jgi:hypothetical protein
MTLLITDGLPRGLGYYEIDNRAAHNELPPGTIKHFEADTYTCSHCEAVVVLNPSRVRERYKCKGCNHHICDECAAKRVAGDGCRTYAQFIDELRERDERQPESSSILLP